jgi:hypothetical protein
MVVAVPAVRVELAQHHEHVLITQRVAPIAHDREQRVACIEPPQRDVKLSGDVM